MTVRKFFGGLLMVIGALAAVFTGGCTLFFLIITFADGLPDISIALTIGGVPFLISLVIFGLGKLIWPPREEYTFPPPTEEEANIEEPRPGTRSTALKMDDKGILSHRDDKTTDD